MSVNIKTNIVQVGKQIQDKLGALTNETILRPVMFGLVDIMTKRIHIDGRDSGDQQIGIYSDGYMAVRTGNFKNAERFKKGKKKGQVKNAGVITKTKVQLFGTTESVFAPISSLGRQRENYNRSDDRKVVISLTRQLENDWSVEPTQKGYGIGFKNVHNFKKTQYVEWIYKKPIFTMTHKENKYAIEYINDLVNAALSE